MMLDKCVPNHYWGSTILVVVYLINCVLSQVLDFHMSLDVQQKHVSHVSVSKCHPKVQACVAYVHIYYHQWSKLDVCAF